MITEVRCKLPLWHIRDPNSTEPVISRYSMLYPEDFTGRLKFQGPEMWIEIYTLERVWIPSTTWWGKLLNIGKTEILPRTAWIHENDFVFIDVYEEVIINCNN